MRSVSSISYCRCINILKYYEWHYYYSLSTIWRWRKYFYMKEKCELNEAVNTISQHNCKRKWRNCASHRFHFAHFTQVPQSDSSNKEKKEKDVMDRQIALLTIIYDWMARNVGASMGMLFVWVDVCVCVWCIANSLNLFTICIHWIHFHFGMEINAHW